MSEKSCVLTNEGWNKVYNRFQEIEKEKEGYYKKFKEKYSKYKNFLRKKNGKEVFFWTAIAKYIEFLRSENPKFSFSVNESSNLDRNQLRKMLDKPPAPVVKKTLSNLFDYLELGTLENEDWEEVPKESKVPSNKISENYNLQTFDFNVVKLNDKGEIKEEKPEEAYYFTQNTAPSSDEEEEKGKNITLDMVYIPGGTFMMGTNDTEVKLLVEKYKKDFFNEEKPQHEVTVPQFFMGKHKVTQKQWKDVASVLPEVYQGLHPEPSQSQGDDFPVENISWYDAVEFCARLSDYTGRKYRLPSEAEWEYACRAETTTPFNLGETITGHFANYRADETFDEESETKDRRGPNLLGEFHANAFGLYDMHGNVNEWCLDDYHKGYEGAPTDGSPWFNDNDNDNIYQKKGEALVRGGSFNNTPESCRSAARQYSIRPKRDTRSNQIGFRVVCEVEEDS